MRAVIWIILLLAAGVSTWWLTAEENRERLTGFDGFIESGSKFGVSIGMPTSAANSALVARGFLYLHSDGRGSCSNRVYPAASVIEVWKDRGWPRTATVCLESATEIVTSVSWYYSWGPDF